MKSLTAICVSFLVAASPASAAMSAGALCRSAIALVAANGTTPPHLLAAIGLVESGRPDPEGGAATPWPWTIDAGGDSLFLSSKEQAIAAVRTLQAAGVRSIDVGCMQINLEQHPAAFATLEEAFDPLANVRYAARFLASLYGRTGQWPDAAALYHSATPDLGEAYRRKVLALWPGGARVVVRSDLARAWGATLPGSAEGFTLVRRRSAARQPGRRSNWFASAAP